MRRWRHRRDRGLRRRPQRRAAKANVHRGCQRRFSSAATRSPRAPKQCDDGTNDGTGLLGLSAGLFGAGCLVATGWSKRRKFATMASTMVARAECMASCIGIQSCGDSLTQGTELCDDGVNDGDPGSMRPRVSLTIRDVWRRRCPKVKRSVTTASMMVAKAECVAGCLKHPELRRRGDRGHRAVRRRHQQRWPRSAWLSAGLSMRRRRAVMEWSKPPELCDDGVNNGDEGQCLPRLREAPELVVTASPKARRSATTASTMVTQANVHRVA